MKHTFGMKPVLPDLDPRAAERKKLAREKDDSRLWHPSQIEFSKGVEVSEGTIPGELWELFRQPDDAQG